jgi:phosphatidylglycerophosphate synthase
MLSRLLRSWSPDLLRPFIRFLVAARVTANQLTLAGLLLALMAGVQVALGALPLAALSLGLSGFLDALDGELARQTHSESPLGAFLDSLADHYGDFAVYLGLALLALQSDDRTLVILTIVAMFGSLVGSHVRSRAAMVGIETKDVGIFTRAERIVVLVLGFATGLVLPAVAVLACANNVSALQRLAYVTQSRR